MNKYQAAQALDAEIKIDLEKGTFRSDYSLNNFKNLFESNHSTVLNVDYKKPLYIRVAYTLFRMLVMPFLSVAVGIFHIIITALSKTFIIQQHPNIAFKSQQLLKWIYSHVSGMREYIIIGRLDGRKVEHTIPNNIWCQYELDGDYKDKIKSVELLRNFIKHVWWDEIRFKQAGWNLILTFTEPPQHGSCILRYLA